MLLSALVERDSSRSSLQRLRSLHISILEDGLAPMEAASAYSFVRICCSPAPSPAVLSSLLASTATGQERDLASSIQTPTEAAHVEARARMKLGNADHALVAASEWDRARAAYDSLAASFPGRVRLCIDVA